MSSFKDKQANVYFYGKDDQKYCKECNKQVADLEYSKYKGLCIDCWSHIGVKVSSK